MKIFQSGLTYKAPVFTSTMRVYNDKGGNEIGTHSRMFRNDMNWTWLANMEYELFKDKDKVNIVQYAASDGSEAYTQIISLLEYLGEKDSKKFFPIKAYDIDEEVVNAAKSGLLNIHENEYPLFKKNRLCPEKYFFDTDQKLEIKNETLLGTKTFKVNPNLTKRVNFELADMFELIKILKDKSNTVLLCRNILPYFEVPKIQEFLNLAGQHLKSGSLLAIGDLESLCKTVTENINNNGFMCIMKNVFQKI